MQSTMQKIAFVTDLHIDESGILPGGRDTRKQLIEIINHLKKNEFDGIILGGDLCNQYGDTSIYNWIYELFSAQNLTIYPISGNHDNSTILAKAFGLQNYLTNTALYYKIEIGQVSCLLLDTSTGSMDSAQWQWLENELAASTNVHQYIFMHHPPIICHAKHMEPKYMFKEIDRYKMMCQKFNNKTFHITTGHYHIEKTVIYKNMHVYVSPSTFVQIDPNKTTFESMHPYIGYRVLMIENNTYFNTHTIYL